MNKYEREYEKHRSRVSEFCQYFSSNILYRGETHDYSKMLSPEKEMFKRFDLKDTEYGTDEYMERLEVMKKEGLNHHYASNRHHPEHFENGIRDMTLIDLVEMLCDWLSAMERQGTVNIDESLYYCKERFDIGDELYSILLNTVKEMKLVNQSTDMGKKYFKMHSHTKVS